MAVPAIKAAAAAVKRILKDVVFVRTKISIKE
jgi:hypothetical protein